MAQVARHVIFLLTVIPVSLGRDGERQMAYLWDGAGLIVTAKGGLWSEATGSGEVRLPQGLRIVRVWSFLGTDPQSCVEGDLNLSRGGVAVSLFAPHNRRPETAYDGWSQQTQDYPTSGSEPFTVRWVCRVTCGTEARCHFGMQVEMR